MSSISLLLVILSLTSLTHCLPLSESNLISRATGEVVVPSLSATEESPPVTNGQVKPVNSDSGPVAYNTFTGNGYQWPTIDNWVTFEEMFTANKPVLSSSCDYWKQPDNTEDEINAIFSGINSATAASGVDQRFILAIMMQESNGCVRIPTSLGWTNNPGLLQDHNGATTCNSNHVKDGQLIWDGQASVPCSSAQITAMISEGTAGTSSGDGLANCLNEASTQGGTAAIAYYWASRIYNSGSYAPGTDLSAPTAGTSCYASDIANRLLGWAGPSTPCTLPNPW